MQGYSDRMNGEGKEGSRCTFHGDVTSYSGTRAACNERFRNYSSAVYRRRAFVRSREKFYTATIRAYPSVHRARFGHREFVAIFVSKIATDEEECLQSEEIFVREISLEDFLGKDIMKAIYKITSYSLHYRTISFNQGRSFQTKFTVVPLDVTFEADTKDRIIPSDVRSTGSSSGCIIVIDSSDSRMKKAAGAVGR
ncbi:hypothetical protein ALC53_05305 [Atta colombica]|uniref:Uncharacterized protein n=1 Tax=Atta colombica TaxID=520822 RepID=A0A195BJH5_9HYME|nr:hypothetical protein ALC53_05305 [Atta colombica]